MTNTRITDVEILEHCYPVRVNRFRIRTGSGGDGHFKGGDGVVREFEFLAPLDVSILTDRRKYMPFGLMGGRPGCPGRNILIRKGESEEHILSSLAQILVNHGDRLIIETPGGGGYGQGKRKPFAQNRRGPT